MGLLNSSILTLAAQARVDIDVVGVGSWTPLAAEMALEEHRATKRKEPHVKMKTRQRTMTTTMMMMMMRRRRTLSWEAFGIVQSSVESAYGRDHYLKMMSTQIIDS